MTRIEERIYTRTVGSGAEKVEHAHLSMWHKENARTREARNSRARTQPRRYHSRQAHISKLVYVLY